MDSKDIEVNDIVRNDTNELQQSKFLVNHKNLTLVQVYFTDKKDAYLYLCENIILHEGDHVYVSGKMKDKLGIVVDVRHEFKVRPSKYERVIAKVDTQLHGDLTISNRFLLSFSRNCIGKEMISKWFFAPQGEEPFISTYTPSPFPLDDLSQFPIQRERLERGIQYYKDQCVVYICLDDIYGYAIVQGSECYEIEFIYQNEMIEDISCGCYCDGHCKHEFALLLELKELVKELKTHFTKQYSVNTYVAAIDKDVLWHMSVRWARRGTISFTSDTEPIIIN